MPANIYNTKNFQKRCFHANSSCPQWAAQRNGLRSVPLRIARSSGTHEKKNTKKTNGKEASAPCCTTPSSRRPSSQPARNPSSAERDNSNGIKKPPFPHPALMEQRRNSPSNNTPRVGQQPPARQLCRQSKSLF